MSESAAAFDFSAFERNGVRRIGELNPYITLACDLRCRYCYMGDYLTKAGDKMNIMSPDFLFGLVRLFIESGQGLDRVRLLGGEPTLHPNITEMAITLSKMRIGQLLMTTNAVSLHHLDLSRITPDVFTYLSVSVDGTGPATNDATRGSGTHGKIIQTIKLYREAGIRLTVVHTVTRTNMHHLRDTIAYFADLGVTTLVIHRASLDGNAYNNMNMLVSPQEWVKIRDDLLKFLDDNIEHLPSMTVRVPYLFLRLRELRELGYRPVHEGSYNSPDQSGYRLIVFPPTKKGEGLCYMSADVIGQPGAQLGQVSSSGRFEWNTDPRNEFLVYERTLASSASHVIKHLEGLPEHVPVSDSFKKTIHLGRRVELPRKRA